MKSIIRKILNSKTNKLFIKNRYFSNNIYTELKKDYINPKIFVLCNFFNFHLNRKKVLVKSS